MHCVFCKLAVAKAAKSVVIEIIAMPFDAADVDIILG
jgi:hypothetical protein